MTQVGQPNFISFFSLFICLSFQQHYFSLCSSSATVRLVRLTFTLFYSCKLFLFFNFLFSFFSFLFTAHLAQHNFFCFLFVFFLSCCVCVLFATLHCFLNFFCNFVFSNCFFVLLNLVQKILNFLLIRNFKVLTCVFSKFLKFF